MAEYTDALGVNAQIRFLGKTGTPALGESWQTGIRIGWFTNTEMPPLDAGRVTMLGRTVADVAVDRETTNFTVQQGWNGVGSTNVPTDDEQDDIAEALWTWAHAIKGMLGNNYRLGDVRLYPFLASGNSATYPSMYLPKGTSQDSSMTANLPLDVAYTMSLGTGTRGPSGRGRMFLGGLAGALLQANGAPHVASATTLRTSTAALLNTLRSDPALALNYAPVIHTRGTDTGSVINRVRTNSLFETQRRRDAQAEVTWSTQTLD